MKTAAKKINDIILDQIGREVSIGDFQDTTSKTGNQLIDILANLSNGHNELAEQQLHDYFISQAQTMHENLMAQENEE